MVSSTYCRVDARRARSKARDRQLEAVSNQEGKSPEALDTRWLSAESLEGLRGFRVEWDDGSTGIAGGIAVFVRTPGFGSDHPSWSFSRSTMSWRFSRRSGGSSRGRESRLRLRSATGSGLVSAEGS